MNGEAELHFKKEKFTEEKVKEKVSNFPFKEYWKVEVKPKEFIAKFRPPRIKILKEFKRI